MGNIVFEKVKEILVMFDRNPLRGLLTEFRDYMAFHISEDVIKTGLSVIKDDIVTFKGQMGSNLHNSQIIQCTMRIGIRDNDIYFTSGRKGV